MISIQRFGDKTIPVFCSEGVAVTEFTLAVKSPLFKKWASSVSAHFIAASVDIQSVDMFGDRVGFIKLRAEVKDKKGNPLPGIVFLRGPSVAVLVVVRCGDELHTILTNQPRLPTGDVDFLEIPAGMIDGNMNFVGKAAQELKEELGITIPSSSLESLSRQLFLSPGGCDETIQLFACEMEFSRDQLIELEGKATGLVTEREQISLKVIPLANLPQFCRDAKSLLAYHLYISRARETR